MPYAAGLATALLLSGCGGPVPPAGPATAPLVAPSDSAGVASGGTPTTRATTTSVEVDPVVARIPKAARPNTQAGAEAFARFFMQQVAKAGVEADPGLIVGLYAGSCKTCQNFTATAETFRTEGLRHTKPALRVTSTTAYTWVDDTRVIGVHADEESVDIVNTAGNVVRQTKDGEAVFHVALRYATHWEVIAVGVEG